MKKRMVSIILAAGMALSLGACGNNTSNSASGGATDSVPENNGTVYELKWGHVGSVGNFYDVAARNVAEEVAEKTNGAVQITVYPNSELGTQAEMTESLITGVLDIVNTSTSVLSAYDQKVMICDLPFLFNDREHAYRVFDDPDITEEIFGNVESSVGPVVAIWENAGFRQLYTSTPVSSLADLKGMKLRVMESQIYIDLAECLGCQGVPMALSELYTALSQRTVDGADNGVAGYCDQAYYEVAPYLIMTNHTYSPSIVEVSPMLKDKIGEENYNILVDVIKANTDSQRQLSIADEQKYLDMLQDPQYNCTIVEFDAAEKQAFVDACAPIWEKYADIVGQDLIDEVRALA